ncbi:hypothetical protein [Thauera sp.]|uniref:hypothetical protein n=1 Tax=Thauera sp. TaxID=1905334 RepID=UPI002B71338E|nr:hypothetical protein [Thauera sp.]HRP25372.1 hypothetical protein [Thauera sp.]
MALSPRSITTMRLPADLLDALTQIATRRGMSRTRLVEKELAAFIKREQARPADDADPFA